MKRNGWRKNLVFYGAVLLVAAGLIAAASYYARETQQSQATERDASMADASKTEAELSRVKVFRPFPMEIQDVLTIPGTVEAFQDIDLAAPVGGTVRKVAVQEGDSTEAGRMLLELDMTQQEAQLLEAKVNFALADGNRSDMEKLFSENIISKSERNEAVGLAERAKAVMEAQQARVDEGAVESPIAGVVDRLSVDVGEHVNPGQTVMKIVDIDRIKVVLNIPEKDIQYMRNGTKVQISTRLDGKEFNLEGTIDFVAMGADPASRTYPVKVVAGNEGRRLRPGMIVTARVVRRSVPNALALPFFSVMDREGGPIVYVVEDGEAHERPVETRAIQGGIVEIASGLKEGEAVVVVGQRSLIDGERVTISADLTEPAKQLIAQGVDVARLPLDMTN